MTERVLVLLNPRAGQRRQRKTRRFLEALERSSVAVDVQTTRFAGEATELTVQALNFGPYTCIVAAGGDGTIAEVVTGFQHAAAQGFGGKENGPCVRLGIFPLGTANVFARELNIPFAPRQNIQLLLSGQCRMVWLGQFQKAEGRNAEEQPAQEQGYFIQMAGIGFDAQCVQAVSGKLKNALGPVAYLWAALGVLRQFSFRPFVVRCDGKPFKAHSAVIAKGKLYGGRFCLAPLVSVSEQSFSVLLLQGGKGALFRLLAGMVLGRPACFGGVTEVSARDVEVRQRGLPFQSDGDGRGLSPVRVTIAPFPLQIAAPHSAY